MIDGIAEKNILGTNDMAGPAYSLHNIERIEIIWGPVSALYGANAFGGVINMISKKGGDMNGLHAEAGFGTFNTSLQNVRMGMKNSSCKKIVEMHKGFIEVSGNPGQGTTVFIYLPGSLLIH